jgi:hypothetical protein
MIQASSEWAERNTLLEELERKQMRLVRKEIAARERAGLVITPQWLDALERKYMALVWQKAAEYELAEPDSSVEPNNPIG